MSSASAHANAAQDPETDSIATNLSGLEGPVAQGLGDSSIHLEIWTLLERKLFQLPRCASSKIDSASSRLSLRSVSTPNGGCC